MDITAGALCSQHPDRQALRQPSSESLAITLQALGRALRLALRMQLTACPQGCLHRLAAQRHVSEPHAAASTSQDQGGGRGAAGHRQRQMGRKRRHQRRSDLGPSAASLGEGCPSAAFTSTPPVSQALAHLTPSVQGCSVLRPITGTGEGMRGTEAGGLGHEAEWRVTLVMTPLWPPT